MTDGFDAGFSEWQSDDDSDSLSAPDGRPDYPLDKMRGRQNAPRREESRGRTPPQAPDVERQVLGAMLVEEEAIPEATDRLDADMFYRRTHALIFDAIAGLFESGASTDLVAVSDELRRRERLEDVGGSYYLTELTADVASTENVEYHARIIEEKAILRAVIEDMSVVVSDAYDAGADALEVLEKAERTLFDISAETFRETSVQTAEQMSEAVAVDLSEGVSYRSFGYEGLDDRFFGWCVGRLNVVAARPNQGKTAFVDASLLNRARQLHSSDKEGQVVKFDIEQTPRMGRLRMLANLSGVGIGTLMRVGSDDHDVSLSSDQREAVEEAREEWHSLPMTVDSTPDVDVAYIRSRLVAERTRAPIDAAYVDYLGQMNEDGDDPMLRMMNAIHGLHIVSRQLEVPIIALTQINRSGAEGDGQPTLNDLAWSDDAAKKTATVALLYYPHGHWQQSGRQGGEPDPTDFTITFAKHKGPMGSHPLEFNPDNMRFHDHRSASANDQQGGSMQPDDELPF